MLNRRLSNCGRGVSLVELLIGISVLAILVMTAVPSFTGWLQNLQIRNSAHFILSGLQQTRAQAVQRNLNTELVLLAQGVTPTAASVGNAGSVNGKNWLIRNFQANGVYTAADFIAGQVGEAGSKNAFVNAGQATFVFNPLGRLLNPPATNININVTSVVNYSNRRPMRVVVSTTGQVAMCDPNGSDASNPQFC